MEVGSMSVLSSSVPIGAPSVAPLPERETVAPRTRLRVVRPPAPARTRTPFVVLCMGVLGTSLVGTLLLNTSMAQGEYQRIALQSRLALSVQNQERVLIEIERRSSPAEIAEAASRLGMVPASGGGYLRLSDGAVLGDPTPAPAPEPEEG
jgi:hypothetical protein